MEQTRRFAKICASLSSASQEERLFDYLIEGLHDLGFSLVLVLTSTSEDDNRLQGRGGLGFEEEFSPQQVQVNITHGEDILSKVYLSGRLVVVPPHQSPEGLGDIKTSVRLQDYSLILAPLSRKGSDKTYGVILGSKKNQEEFTEEQKAFFHTIAQQAGLILEKIHLQQNIQERSQQLQHRIYELTILQELSQRIGYELNIERIATIIVNSLSKLLEFSAVSYTLVKPNRVIFSCHLEKMVNRDFVDSMKEKTLDSLNTVMGTKYETKDVEEVLSGTILDETQKEPLRSFFNVPFVINKKPVGVLTVASTRAGLYKEDEMTILYKITNLASDAVSKLQNVIETEKGKLKDMVESMADGIIMVNKKLTLEVINSQALSLLHIKKENPSIFEVLEVLPENLNLRSRLEKTVKEGKSEIIDQVTINDRVLRILITPAKSKTLEGEQILGSVILLHDITKEKELQQLREEFTSMMVHELRSPLDGIKKMSELLLKEETRKDEKNLNKFLNLIHKESSEMLSLVGDLLDIAKAEAGKLTIHKKAVNIKEILEDRYNYFLTQASEANLTFEKKLSPELPEKIQADENRIKQVLNNLLSNAIKFTPEGGKVTLQAFTHKKDNNINLEAKAAQIDWRLEEDHKELTQLEDSVVIAVTDTGIGIKKENQEKIFEKFQQFKASVESGKRGTGLGLAVTKEIVKAHGGQIGVASEPNKGSTFYFTIPLKSLNENRD